MELLDRVLGSVRALGDRVAVLLKLPRARRSSPEPFAAVEDSTPTADALLEPNAAYQRKAKGKAGPAPREKIDFRAALEALLRNKPLLASLAALLVLLLAIAVAGVVVSVPAKPLPALRGPTREGVAVARRMIPPPLTSFGPRLPMEREDAKPYTMEDAAEMGLEPAAEALRELSARNDAAIEALFGTVR